MVPLGLSLGGVAVLLALSAAAAFLGRGPRGVPVYPISAAVTGVLGLGAVAALLGAETAATVLPLGVPWIGAHFRIDPLASVFLAVVDFGACAASLYAIGYGRHDTDHGEASARVLPFYPAFLAGMNLVVLAADAFSFLLAWEFMSLASWALVMAEHREPGTSFAGYVYLVMASFGTLALLLGFGLLAGPDGGYTFAEMRAAHPSATLGAPSPISSIPAASSAPISFTSESTLPRIVPSLASMRWMVGSDSPEASARARWSMPRSARAARN